MTSDKLAAGKKPALEEEKSRKEQDFLAGCYY